ncbi:hypothetical protein HZS_7435, partial [Henneguya salminicola]
TNSESGRVYFSVGLLKILCCLYLFSIIFEIIISLISVCCFKYMLPSMILSTLAHRFTDLNKNIFYKNSVNFRFWNIINFPITLLTFAAPLFLLLIQLKRQKNCQDKEIV